MLVMIVICYTYSNKNYVSDVDCNMLYVQIKNYVSDVDCNMLYV